MCRGGVNVNLRVLPFWVGGRNGYFAEGDVFCNTKLRVAYRPESGLLKEVCKLYKVDKLCRAEEGSRRVAWGGLDGL